MKKDLHETITSEELINLFNEYDTKSAVAQSLDISRPYLDKCIECSGFGYKQWRQKNYTPRQSRTLTPNEVKVIRNTDEISEQWIEEARKHSFTVYTLEIQEEIKKIYIGYSGDLSARIYQHMHSKFKGKQIKITSCEFFDSKDFAMDREKELIHWHFRNEYNMINAMVIKSQFFSDDPRKPFPGDINKNGIVFPSYIGFMEFCKNNQDLPLTKKMYQNCEVADRKHWRSISRDTIDIIRTMMID